jgi:uncharacterized iron-regulated membrane protein
MNWHGAIGVWILPVVLLLSATGMTWSTYAGENVTKLREELSWTTPAVSVQLPGTAGPAQSSGGDHHSGGQTVPAPADPSARIAQLDRVYEVARAEGITQGAEIAIPATPEKAFGVKELRMPGTYTIDSLAVDGSTGTVTDRLAFADWPLMAKLTNWGIAFHMGLLFGLVNQLLLLAIMAGLVTVIVLGYRMWWQRRPTRRAALPVPPRRGVLRRTSPWITVPLVGAAVAVGWFLPLIGVSLIVFLLIDVALGLAARADTV